MRPWLFYTFLRKGDRKAFSIYRNFFGISLKIPKIPHKITAER